MARAHRWAVSLALGLLGFAGCGDRAPGAQWPRPEPPSLAEPLERGPAADASDPAPVPKTETAEPETVEPETAEPETAEPEPSGEGSSGPPPPSHDGTVAARTRPPRVW